MSAKMGSRRLPDAPAELEQTNSKRLTRKVREILARIEDNDTDQNITIEVSDDGTQTSIVIKPETYFWHKGSSAAESALIILGPRGGLRMAEVRSAMTSGSIDYAEKQKHKWRRLLNRLERLN